ncbi:hypothetical protein [Streptomyces sp. NPDC054975]
MNVWRSATGVGHEGVDTDLLLAAALGCATWGPAVAGTQHDLRDRESP